MARTLFGHPIREETTAAFFPEKQSLDDFEQCMKDAVEGFAQNMRAFSPIPEPRYIEEWTEMWLAWCEIEEERPRRFTINDISNRHFEWVKEMGWVGVRTPLETLALIVFELGEAANEVRGKEPTEKLGMELADVVLRTMAFAKEMNIDLAAEIEKKMALNRERGSRGRIK